MILQSCTVVCALGAVTSTIAFLWLLPSTANAFVTPSRAPWTTTVISNSGLVQKTTPLGSLHKARGASALSMGVFEDFLTGQDSSARSKENAAYLTKLQQRVERSNELEAEIEELGDDELQAKTAEFKQRLAAGEDINGKLLEEAFAVVREAAW